MFGEPLGLANFAEEKQTRRCGDERKRECYSIKEREKPHSIVDAPYSVLALSSYFFHLPMHRRFPKLGWGKVEGAVLEASAFKIGKVCPVMVKTVPKLSCTAMCLWLLTKETVTPLFGNSRGLFVVHHLILGGSISESVMKGISLSGNSLRNSIIVSHARCTVLPSVMAMATFPPCFCISPMAACMVLPEVHRSSNRTTFLPEILPSSMRSLELRASGL